MARQLAKPKYLYKYKPFGELLLKELNGQEVYYCKPQQFNDPLDCKPLIADDLDLKHLEQLAYKLLTYKKPDDTNWAISQMNHFRYSASEFGKFDDGKEGERDYRYSMRRVLEDDLVNAVGDIGILSLSQKWNSMLMWSHYANNHRGICLEFEFDDNHCEELEKVDYDSPRGISAKDLYRWRVNSDIEAAQRVRHSFIFTKSSDWGYEAEWRATRSPSGSAPSPFKLRSILFGARCDSSIITTLVKLFSGGEVNPRFYELHLDNEHNRLRRTIAETGELETFGVRKSAIFRQLEIEAMFAQIDQFEEPTATPASEEPM